MPAPYAGTEARILREVMESLSESTVFRSRCGITVNVDRATGINQAIENASNKKCIWSPGRRDWIAKGLQNANGAAVFLDGSAVTANQSSSDIGINLSEMGTVTVNLFCAGVPDNSVTEPDHKIEREYFEALDWAARVMDELVGALNGTSSSPDAENPNGVGRIGFTGRTCVHPGAPFIESHSLSQGKRFFVFEYTLNVGLAT